MEYTWRSLLKKHIEDHYKRMPAEWFDMTISTGGMLNLTIVSDCFEGIPMPQRREEIQNLLRQYQVPMSPGFLSLYTIQEAESIGLSQPKTFEEIPIYSWYDLASWAANAEDQPKRIQREPRVPRTIAFYSFKGGVGRTTALTHVAWILAMRGRKVVAVDLDLEAPGLSSALNLTPVPPYGIVDYFYERSYLPKDIEPTISIAEVFGEVRIPDATGRFFVVPAGSLSLDYIAKVDDLRAAAITERGEDLWSTFYREITEQLQPDIILVDSRTGINEWGAFSLLRAADKAIVFLYPNEQNRHGIDLLLESLANKISLQLVFSPVPFGDAGMEKVREYWLALQDRLNVVDQSSAEVDEALQSEIENESQSEIAEPITVQYLTELALASSYPVLPLLSHYMNIANVVDEDTTAISLGTVLTDKDRRWKIIESLQFPKVDAADPKQNLRDLFQRTAQFDLFLDDATCLIRGRKGTGKSALYSLLLKHEEVARELSRGRLSRATCMSGHGSFYSRPTRGEFQLIDQSLEQRGGSWEAFWRAYLLLRMYLENHLQLRGTKDNKFNDLRSVLGKLPKGDDNWPSEYTYALIEMATNGNLDMLAKDMLRVIDEQQRKNSQVFWFLYDDLDVDLPDKGGVRQRALTGLFQLVQASDARRLTAIRFKIFLREDIWSRLRFDNKSHFNGRDLLLQWTRADFLRLVLRQTIQSEEFKDLVDRFSPVESIDNADEESIDRALQLLWGSRREPNEKSKYVSRWVYDRLTDASGTTFPRILNILLETATKHELTANRRQPAPTDRLIRATSLNVGLVEASKERCDEIREEYPELRAFFDYLVGFDVLASEETLRIAWQETVPDMLPTFKEFVDFLLNIGLIGLAELREREQGYRFADIYAHGFKMYRGRRKY